MAIQFLVVVERDGADMALYIPSDPAKVDAETSLGDTAVEAARLKYPGAFCYLRLDNQGRRVKRDSR